MLGFLDDINKQTAQLPTPEADQVWMKILPTYHKEESLGPVTFDGEILPLTRSVVRINAVYHGAFNGGHAFRQSPARLSMNRRNVTNRNEHDPLYTLVNNGTDPAALRFDIPTGFLSNWSTENVYCHYVPVPTNPEDQSPEDTLDFEPMYYNSIISKAMMLVNVGSQDYQQAETMQLLTGAN